MKVHNPLSPEMKGNNPDYNYKGEDDERGYFDDDQFHVRKDSTSDLNASVCKEMLEKTTKGKAPYKPFVFRSTQTWRLYILWWKLYKEACSQKVKYQLTRRQIEVTLMPPPTFKDVQGIQGMEHEMVCLATRRDLHFTIDIPEGIEIQVHPDLIHKIDYHPTLWGSHSQLSPTSNTKLWSSKENLHEKWTS
jgi:hypothetical protein